MIVDLKKVKELVVSACYNTVSCLFNNLIYLVIIHYLSLNSKDASLQQNGISLACTVLIITFDPIIIAFSMGLKILYSQFDASQSASKSKNFNFLLYQCIVFTCILGIAIIAFLLLCFEYFFKLLSYEQDTIDMSKIGLMYIFVSKIAFLIYEYQRSQLLGMKVFGPFAYFQTASFVITTIFCEIFQNISEVGIHQAGLLFIIHDTIKVLILFLYKKRNNNTPEKLQNTRQSETIYELAQLILKERKNLIDLVNYVKPIFLIVLIECFFFNASVILSGKFSNEYIVTAVCFQMTNTLIFKGIMGLYESLVSFSGTAFATRDFVGAKHYLVYTISILLIYEALFITFLLLFSDFWAGSFSQDPQVIHLINLYKYIYIFTIPFDGTQVLLSAYLQTIELKQIVKKTEFISFIIIGIPTIYIMGVGLDLKLGGIWLAIGFCNLINLITYLKVIKSIDYEVQHKIIILNQDIIESNNQSDQLTELLPVCQSDQFLEKNI
ncbi:MATE efflux family protein (macronuclear) [Tetrahymena thermophila SB210]|uniref:MATE efflux family protein n=1 Tax=Tetrahymena thermophila (strain SB210) TaxID=312017 RepID=Q248E3_TETTS|nr:MATE efflux family protein [Tetrahymena thermophila SB210]EAS04102.1 MATE efflux family protein [Tetrahymena thermophila SB210]|eukprot:XP_001024347.1 MATE efflux family protein [Tetrahymena thermophila SB210]